MSCVRRLRDAEDGNDPARRGDLNWRDRGFDESFALAVAARADDLVDVIGDLAQRGGRRHGRFRVERPASSSRRAVSCRVLVLSCASRPARSSGCKVPFSNAARYRSVAALVLASSRLVAASSARRVLSPAAWAGLGCGNRPGDEVVLVAVEAGDCAGDGGLGGVGVDPLTLGVIGAPRGQELLRLIERGLLDDWRVAAGGGDAAER
jgi:hypothetical protein